jgi:hypothetical protein
MKNPLKSLPNNPFAALVSFHPGTFSSPPAADRSSSKSLRGWLLARIERWAWNARQRDLERALTSATDLADVERRLRAHERGLLQRYY